MNKIVFALIAVALLSASVFLINHKKETHSMRTGIPKEIIEEFQMWKFAYGKSYPNQDIETYKLNVFYANWQMIKSHDTTTGYTMAPNQFMDLNAAEFKATMLTAIPINEVPLDVEVFDNEDDGAPSSVDWRTSGKVSPVKNQGQCGSCWAFSCTGANESCDAIFGSGVGDFSEQQLVDCSGMYGNLGCNGGQYYWANKYVISQGITTEQAYPYTGVQGKCKTQGGAWKISSQTLVTPGSCSGLTNAIAQQPTSVQVDASNWQFYSTGVFSNCGTNVDHDVLAVGYTPTYWIVKNSWGVSWGMQGYINLKPGNTCAICSQAGFPNK